MGPIESLILQAWQRLKNTILSDPAELGRRLARCRGKTYSRPPRAWCLAVRACDRRIGIHNGRIEPEYATDPRDPDHPGRVVEHTVTLTGALVRELCCPVRLEPGGELRDDAARKLGVCSTGLTNARINGSLRTRHVKGLLGRPGRPVPLVSSEDPLDACAGRGFAMPHPLWIGNEYVSARAPYDLEQTIVRVPVYVPAVSRHQYDGHAHPELAGPTPRRQRRLLPPAQPDYVWYKWSKSGEYLGDDPKNWRKRPSDPGTPPPPGAATKRKRTRKP